MNQFFHNFSGPKLFCSLATNAERQTLSGVQLHKTSKAGGATGQSRRNETCNAYAGPQHPENKLPFAGASRFLRPLRSVKTGYAPSAESRRVPQPTITL